MHPKFTIFDVGNYGDGYGPHPGQIKVHNAIENKEVIFISAGKQSGKTSCCAYEVVYQIMRAIIEERQFKVWCCGPTYDLASRIIEQIAEIIQDPDKLDFTSEGWIESCDLRKLIIRFKHGSFVKGKTTENPKSLLGDTVDLVIIDEAARVKDLKTIFYELETRTAIRKGKMLVISTPMGRDDFCEFWHLAKVEYKWKSFKFKTSDNPGYPKHKLAAQERRLDKDSFEQDFNASFRTMAGRYFKSFDEKNVRAHHYDPTLETGMSLDFGVKHPMIQYYQVDADDNIYIFDEWAGEDVEVGGIIQIVKSKPYDIQIRCCDPAGNATNTQTGISDVMAFERAGIPLLYSYESYARDVVEGSKIIRSKIKNCFGDRSLFVDKDRCPVTYKSLLNILVDKHSQKYKKDGTNDHAIDCLRYFMVNRFPLDDEDEEWYA